VRLVRERRCCVAALLGEFLGTIVPGGTGIESRDAEPSFAFVPLDNRVKRRGALVLTRRRCRPPQAAMPLCSELMSRPKKAVAGYRPERTTPGGPSRAGRGRQYCKLRWLPSAVIGIFLCTFELKMPRPVIWQRFTSTNSCHEPPLRGRPFALGQVGYRGALSEAGARRNPRDKHGTSETCSVREWPGKAKRMTYNLLG